MVNMERKLPEDAQHVQDFLVEKGSDCKVRLLPDTTATAQEAAKALGVPVSHIGKSIVFGKDDCVIVAIICGDQRVDVAALGRILELTDIKPLRADDVKRHTGYVIGGVSPFGLPSGTIIVLDSYLSTFQKCYVAAGHPKAVIQVNLEELVAITKAMVSPIAIKV
jgi:Cys-tRNA(Pro) deacylase